MTRFDPAARRFVPLLVLLCLVGCGKSKSDVQGTVSFQGKPIEEGQIRFIPQPGTVGPVTGSSIVQGAYRSQGPGAVPIGKHRVEITAHRPGQKKKADDKEAAGLFEDEPATVQYIPEKYNTRSELELVVPEGSRSLEKNFDLP